ncbi:MAG: HD domain-containing protein [Dehalococcoidia bacterium]|nr:HD domain-containing protein [Dehalococcoidia bacterium]
MVTRQFLVRLFNAAYMQRWNDQIRPVELTELDKQAHKMVIAYVLGKYQEQTDVFDWPALIEAGIFEYLQRLVLTDLKPQVFYKIKEDPARYQKLNDWVYSELENAVMPLGNGFCERFRRYLAASDELPHQRVLHAAHFFATRWEFDIIRRTNPEGHEMGRIGARLESQQEQYLDLPGLRELILRPGLRSFVDLCGLLRFQVRWSHVHRIPRTSVLGHMLVVAMVSYLLSLERGCCPRRSTNNYFTGLFHDLPEALTRDIISPVKYSVEGLSSLIKSYEREEMQEKVYPLVPKEWHADLSLFTEDEFRNVAFVNGACVHPSALDMDQRYNSDEFNSRDGEMVKAVDDLAAFMEAYLTRENGISSPELERAMEAIGLKYADGLVAGVDLASLHSWFSGGGGGALKDGVTAAPVR